MEKITNQDSIPVKDIAQAVIEKAGCAPKKPLQWGVGFKTRWGGRKNDNFGFSGDSSGQFGTLWDYRDGSKQTFYIKKEKIPGGGNWGRSVGEDFQAKGYSFKEKKPDKTPKSCQKEWQKLKNLGESHPYLEKKGIKREDLPLKIDSKGNLIVYVAYRDEIISWQRIPPSEGKKKFKKDHPLPAGHYFQLGPLNRKMAYVCEGFATGVSIQQATDGLVFCAFTKNNLDALASGLMARGLKVCLCLDNDGAATHRTRVKGLEAVLCPDKEGDFNDHEEGQKLRDLKPQYKIPKEALLSKSLKDVEIIPTEYIDSYGMFPRRRIVVTSGPKSSLKSRGVIEALLWEKSGPDERGLRIGYYSDGEIYENDAKAIESKARAAGAKGQLVWIKMEKQQELGTIFGLY